MCAHLVPLQELPSYNDKRRRQSLFVEQSPTLLQRSCSNPQIYYGRGKTLNGVKGSSTMLSCTSLPQRRFETARHGVNSPSFKPLGFTSDARRQCLDTDSLNSLSVSGASSLSGLLIVREYVITMPGNDLKNFDN